MTKPPFLPYGRQLIEDDDVDAVVRVLRGPALTQGPKIAEFEAAVASYVGAKHAVAVASGTAALHLACLAAGVGPGGRVVTSPITFLASANCAIYAGGDAAFCDVDASTVNMDPAGLEAVLRGAGARAVIPVHFAGAPCDMDAIHRVASARGAAVIEDAAHALGAVYPSGKRVGSCEKSLMTIFSFHPVKLIAAGEGGMITTNDDAVHEKLLRLRNHGIHKGTGGYRLPEMAMTGGEINPWYYEMQDLGFHYRMTDIQAALGLSQLSKIDRFLSRRRALVARYDAAFAGLKGVGRIQKGLREVSAHHLYVLRIDYKALGVSRRDVMRRLADAGIGTQVHYIPVHLQPFYRERGHKPGDHPVAEAYYDQALSIPLYPAMTDADQDRVIEAVAGVAG